MKFQAERIVIMKTKVISENKLDGELIKEGGDINSQRIC